MITPDLTMPLAPPPPSTSAPRPNDGVRVTGRRVVAYLADWIIYALIVGWAFINVATNASTSDFATSGTELRLDLGYNSYQLTGMRSLLFIVAAFAFWCLSRAALHTRFGRTPGKVLVGITVTDAHGKRPTLTKALVRELTWPVDGFPYVIPCLVGYVTVLASSDRRRIGDRVARTHVRRHG